MYCKNCGSEMISNAAVCVKCGCAKDVGKSFCPNCGKPTSEQASVCLSCGVSLDTRVTPVNAKSKLVAGLLAILLGALGIHNFYLGYTAKAVTQLLITIFGLFLVVGPIITCIWSLIEGIMIFTGNINVGGHGNALQG